MIADQGAGRIVPHTQVIGRRKCEQLTVLLPESDNVVRKNGIASGRECCGERGLPRSAESAEGQCVSVDYHGTGMQRQNIAAPQHIAQYRAQEVTRGIFHGKWRRPHGPDLTGVSADVKLSAIIVAEHEPVVSVHPPDMDHSGVGILGARPVHGAVGGRWLAAPRRGGSQMHVNIWHRQIRGRKQTIQLAIEPNSESVE